MPTIVTGPFPLSNFQNSDGSAVSNGTLRIRLSQDGTIITGSGSVQLPTNFTDYTLDSSGNSGGIVLYANFFIRPKATYYIYEVFNSSGLLVAGPNTATV